MTQIWNKHLFLCTQFEYQETFYSCQYLFDCHKYENTLSLAKSLGVPELNGCKNALKAKQGPLTKPASLGEAAEDPR